MMFVGKKGTYFKSVFSLRTMNSKFKMLTARNKCNFAVVSMVCIFLISCNQYYYSGFSNMTNNHIELQEGKNTYKVTKTSVPNIIVQYGKPRTASTLQFNILCAIVSLQHIHEIQDVGCFCAEKPPRPPKTLPRYSVIKTHNLLAFKPLLSKSWLMMTTTNFTDSKRIIRFLRHNITIPLVVDISSVRKRGRSIVYQYQSVFGASNQQIEQVADYIQYWDILRICCGSQMSKSWRNYLLNKTKTSSHSYCQNYNISEVETNMMNTYIFKKFSDNQNVLSVLGKPSIKDNDLDGTYCERCNKNISQYKIEFNMPCV